MRPAQPLLPEDSVVLSVFPPRWWAALLPAFVGVLVTTSVLGYIGWVLVTSQLTRYVCILSRILLLATKAGRCV